VPAFQGQVLPLQSDLGDPASVEAVWADLREKDISVDVLVLNAARTQNEASMLDLGWELAWKLFETNVRGNLMSVAKFMGQPESRQKVSNQHPSHTYLLIQDSNDPR
jgi:NADP-dependent 3-hydroxy acid dehydrogenase YdfG